MSSNGENDEVNRREVAYRLFAAEFDDADFSYAESDEERAPNYVVTPTGARVNRVFVVGVLTEVEPVNDDVVRARIVDPTGAFVVYAGQYQPEALAALEAAETPSFVAVTGKARTFEPDDADVIYTSIRPEHVSEVDAETRDRWAVTTAEQTVDRVETMAAARDRVERGDDLQRVLEAADVPHGLAAGIPLALDHYDTSPAYLEAVRGLALDAARVVAGDLDEVEGLSLAPSEGGDVSLDFADTIDVDVEVGADDEAVDDETVESTGAPGEDDSVETGSTEPESESTESESVDSGETEAEPTEAETVTDQADSEIVESADAPDVESDVDETASVDETTSVDETATEDEGAPSEAAESGQSDGEMYELSEEEREEVEENFDVGFSSGSDIPDAGDADIDAPEPDEPATGAADDARVEPEDSGESDLGTEATDADVDADDVTDDDVGPAADDSDDLGDFDDGEDFDNGDDIPDVEDDVDDVDTSEEFTEEEYDDAQSEAEDADAGSMDLDLEDRVVDLMEELDDGDGAPRDEVIAAATDEYDADEGEIEDAIQSALMGGRCYEAGDDHLKAI